MTENYFDTKEAVLYLYINHCIEHATVEQRKALEAIYQENEKIFDRLISLFDLGYLKSQLALLPDLSAIMANMDKKYGSIGDSMKECKCHIIPVQAFRWNR